MEKKKNQSGKTKVVIKADIEKEMQTTSTFITGIQGGEQKVFRGLWGEVFRTRNQKKNTKKKKKTLKSPKYFLNLRGLSPAAKPRSKQSLKWSTKNGSPK